jgi:hypothetical protein
MPPMGDRSSPLTCAESIAGRRCSRFDDCMCIPRCCARSASLSRKTRSLSSRPIAPTSRRIRSVLRPPRARGRDAHRHAVAVCSAQARDELRHACRTREYVRMLAHTEAERRRSSAVVRPSRRMCRLWSLHRLRSLRRLLARIRRMVCDARIPHVRSVVLRRARRVSAHQPPAQHSHRIWTPMRTTMTSVWSHGVVSVYPFACARSCRAARDRIDPEIGCARCRQCGESTSAVRLSPCTCVHSPIGIRR